MAWLNLTGLKSFTYVGTVLERVLAQIATCELLEEIDVGFLYPRDHGFGKWEPSPQSLNIQS